ncbi:hypothetical protein RhiirA4_490210 [Rhizophagus irregularis]|uniref:Uncharacterized protein n=1 Tax=Rhizophagus irregularis TaxID=588596 RepID=A0A2I1HVG8_9GLOM|nr:hypothetical protein RhiirA4_490210 [Rhizophagus irregularis]
MARAYKKAVAKANAEALLERLDNTKTNEGDKAKIKKKRSLVEEHYYEEFSTEFWKEPESQRSTMPSNITI